MGKLGSLEQYFSHTKTSSQEQLYNQGKRHFLLLFQKLLSPLFSTDFKFYQEQFWRLLGLAGKGGRGRSLPHPAAVNESLTVKL
jgi:hypothetical protein